MFIPCLTDKPSTSLRPLCGTQQTHSLVPRLPRAVRALQPGGAGRQRGDVVLTMLLIILSPPLKVTANMEAHSSA